MLALLSNYGLSAGLAVLAVVLYGAARRPSMLGLSVALAWGAYQAWPLPLPLPAPALAGPARPGSAEATLGKASLRPVLPSEWQHVPPAVAQWRALVEQEAQRHGLDPLLVAAVIERESSGRARAINETSMATGLMQVMPREAGRFYKNAAGVPFFQERPTQAALLDPATNIKTGVGILAGLVRDYGVRGALERYYGVSATGRVYAIEVLAIYSAYKGTRIVLGPADPLRFTASPLNPMPRIFKGFGVPVNYQTEGTHTGVDLSGSPAPDGGEPLLYAVANATVVHVGPLYCNNPRACRGSKAIVLDLGNAVYAIYSHNSEATVTKGQRVAAGERIGRQGNEGYSFGSHLHFEVHTGAPFTGNWQTPFAGGQFIDPAPHLEKIP